MRSRRKKLPSNSFFFVSMLNTGHCFRRVPIAKFRDVLELLVAKRILAGGFLLFGLPDRKAEFLSQQAPHGVRAHEKPLGLELLTDSRGDWLRPTDVFVDRRTRGVVGHDLLEGLL